MMSWIHAECILQLSSYVILVFLHISMCRVILVHLLQKPFEVSVKTKLPLILGVIFTAVNTVIANVVTKTSSRLRKSSTAMRILQKENREIKCLGQGLQESYRKQLVPEEHVSIKSLQ